MRKFLIRFSKTLNNNHNLWLSTRMENLKFRGGNPGAVQHGNFINYYQFHPPENRLDIFPKDIWNKNEPFIGIDIGCNAGDLTISLYNFLTENTNQTCYILGIDIDPILIERAKEKNKNDKIKFCCMDFMDNQQRDNFIAPYLSSLGVTKFSATFCFSITMWIHLNNGDDGLKTFLEQVYNMSRMIVIEPQPWKCYKSAVKRMKLNNEQFPLYNSLKIRHDVEDKIEAMLLQNKNLSKIKETERTNWSRKILFFKLI